MTDEIGVQEKIDDYLIDDMDLSILGEEVLTQCLVKSVKTIMAWQNIDKNRLKGQIKNCMSIIKFIMDGKKSFLISAPTGFGKTILGFMIAEMFKNAEIEYKKHIGSKYEEFFSGSYITTPNKFLQDQYNDDIIRFDLSKSHAQVKGQSNYGCLEDQNLTFATRPCTSISIGKLGEKMKCGKICPYVVARNNAAKSKTSIFNYSYFLKQMNDVYAKGIGIFKPRYLTIFDECHTLEAIVQDTFQKEYDFDSISFELRSGYVKFNEMYGSLLDFKRESTYAESLDKIKNIINWIDDNKSKFMQLAYKCVKDGKTIDNEVMVNFMKDFDSKINNAYTIYEELILREFPEPDEDGEVDYSESEQLILDHRSYLSQLSTSIRDIFRQNDEIGIDFMVVDIKKIKTRKGEKNIVTFRCEKSDALIQKHINVFTNYVVLMSATMGDTVSALESFAQSNGIGNYAKIVNDSDFDFSKSKIISFDPPIKMTYGEKAKNMPEMLTRIRTIISHYPKETGIVHTGNYEFQDALKKYVEDNDLHERFIFCRNAKEKQLAVRQVKWEIEKAGWSNRILVGASLLEGVDLKDDLSRFSIFMKVPYPSMKDALVKRKMDRYEGWYKWATMVQFLQGLGRGVRHKKDYCTTYILDGSFQGFFYYYGELPKIMKGRMIKSTINQWFGKNKGVEGVMPPLVEPLPNLVSEEDEISKNNDIMASLKPVDMFDGII